MTVELFMHLLD